MNFIDKLENKYGKYAVHNLSFYLTIIFILGLIIQLFNSSFYIEYLSLDIKKLLHGQIWRVITFLFYPPGGGSLLFALLSIYVYYSLTRLLSMSMSDFKFNMFFLIGIICQVLAGIIYKVLVNQNIIVFPTYFIFSILLAFCFTYSDSMMLFYFIIPIKAKWIAYFELIFFAMYFINGNLADKIIIIACLINVYIYIKLIKNNSR